MAIKVIYIVSGTKKVKITLHNVIWIDIISYGKNFDEKILDYDMQTLNQSEHKGTTQALNEAVSAYSSGKYETCADLFHHMF